MEEKINGNVKIGIFVGKNQLIFQATWSGGFYLRDVVMIEDIQYSNAYDVYINYFVYKCNSEYKLKILEKEKL